jgi:glucose dehydrogenase
MRRAMVVAVVFATVFVAGFANHDDDRSGSRRPRVAVPREVAENRSEWPLPGRDYFNTRSRTHSRITSKTIASLRPVWSVELPGFGAFGNASTTPIILDDTAYVQDLASNVLAVDVRTGRVRWSHTYNAFQVGPNGVAVGYGRLYVAKGTKEIAALDLKTGAELWSTLITRTPTEGVDIQPTVVDGLVFASTVPVSVQGQFRGGDRGVLWALDARTGQKVWTFDTIADPGLWGHPEINSGGGAWFPPAVDVERGLIYWGIANPAPFPGTPEFPNGSSRPGPNLYTESVVALHIKTGALAWFHQAAPHDLFDRDQHLVAIADLRGVGRKHRVVISTGKTGRVIGLDPDTGGLRFDTAVGIHRNDQLTELNGETTVLPGLFGGVLTPPAVADGVVYVAVLNAPSKHAPGKLDFFGGAPLGVMPGQVVAVSARTGRVLWDTSIEGDPLGGATVVGDLVFTATFQGRIVALNRHTGAIVRTIDAPGGINGWPATTRDTIVWPVGMSKPKGTLVAYRVVKR